MEKAPRPKNLIAIIPMGIPAIGKSKVFEALQKDEAALKNFEFVFVSSDDTRKVCMDEFMKHHPTATEDDAFKGTQGPYKTAFTKALRIFGPRCASARR
jgi:hypothetical protein